MIDTLSAHSLLTHVSALARDIGPRPAGHPAEAQAREYIRRTLIEAGFDAGEIEELPFATPDKVREDVRKNLEAFKPDGGYVFNNVHNIQAGVPAANIVALYDAAYEFGFYN